MERRMVNIRPGRSTSDESHWNGKLGGSQSQYGHTRIRRQNHAARSPFAIPTNISTGPRVIIIIGIQPLGRSGQRPDLSQSTGIALVRCILGKFLGVVCHCFPPPLDVPTFATRCLNDARDPSGGR